ncbi:hypothetical protein HY029_00795 [Candidatus Gottesmanbacteria bacterium]|nr:hypothetical protein [Candidatus Gottesmanbacteria bacterium]
MAKFLITPKVFISTFIIAIFAVVFTIQLSNTSSMLFNRFSFANTILPVPTLVPIKEASKTSEVHSPDGKMKIVMDKTTRPQALANYTITVSEISGTNKKIILSRTLGENQSIQIPDNSWSPDNKYLFLKETDKDKVSFFVFKSTGESFADGKQYIDVVPLFENKKYEYKLSDITGWDSNNLLHVYTVKGDGTKGPSFWFDVEGKNFYILASR